MPTRMDGVIAVAGPAPVVDGQEVTDDHIHAELARWTPKQNWLILSPARSALFASGSEGTDVALERDGSLDNLVRGSHFVLAIMATGENAGEVADSGSHYLCVLYHRANKLIYVYDSLDFRQSQPSKAAVKTFSTRVNKACLLRVQGTYVSVRIWT